MFISKLWSDCDGGILTTELVLVASFVTATLLAGLGTLRNQVSSEFQDLSTSIKSANVNGVVIPNQFDISELEREMRLQGTEIEGGFDALKY